MAFIIVIPLAQAQQIDSAPSGHCCTLHFLLPPWSRFKLNVSAGSQKRKIHKPEGRNESRFSLKSKRNRKRKYILSLFGQTRFYLDKSCHYSDKQTVWAFGRCVQNDSMVGFSEETKRKKRSLKRSEKIPVFQPKHNARFKCHHACNRPT